MSIQIIPQPTTASAIGSSLGQAVSEYLPKELERYRLRKGLENFEKNREGQSLFQQYGNVASIPGMTPGLFSALAPFIQSAGQANALNGLELNPANFAQNNPSASGTSPQQADKSIPNHPNTGPVQAQQAQSQYLQQKANAPVKNLAMEFFQPRYRALYPTFQEAQAGAQKQETDFETAAEKARNAVFQGDKRLAESEVGGEYLQDVLQKYKNRLGPAANVNKLATDYATEVREVAREKASLRDTYKSWNLFNPPTAQSIKDLRSTIKKYREKGIPQQVAIDDLMDTQDIDRGAASYVANPLRDSAAAREIYSLPPVNGLESLDKRNARLDEAAKRAAKNLRGSDLIGSLAYIADAKGYDSRVLQDKIRDYAEENQIPVTEEQRRDFGRRMTQAPKSLPQIWFEVSTGLPLPFTRNAREAALLGSSGERHKARNG